MTEHSRYDSEFQSYLREREGKEPSWMKPLRERAFSRFNQLGFPTRKNEDWKYTKLNDIEKLDFRLTDGSEAPLDREALQRMSDFPLGEHYLVFVDGRFREDLSSQDSLPEGVIFTSLQQALDQYPHIRELLEKQSNRDKEDRAFALLNLAFFTDGAYIEIPAKTKIEAPLHLLFVTTSNLATTTTQIRSLIVAHRFAEAQIIESHLGQPKGYWNNVVTEIEVAASAHIDHLKWENESTETFHFSQLYAALKRDAYFSNHALFFGGKLTRNDIEILLNEENAHATLNGLYIANGTQHIDNRTFIDHAVPRCTSQELYKGILDERGSGVFNGRIIVRPDAQQTDAQQSNQALLLSDDARLSNKPQLEIFADDVKCTHGAATGRLDPDAMFFLRSRGIPQDDAKTLLTFAFANDILAHIPHQLDNELLERLLASKLDSNPSQ